MKTAATVDTPSRWSRLDEFPRWQPGWFFGGVALLMGWEPGTATLLRCILIALGSALVIFTADPGPSTARPDR